MPQEGGCRPYNETGHAIPRCCMSAQVSGSQRSLPVSVGPHIALGRGETTT
jgi:hypothetical protein